MALPARRRRALPVLAAALVVAAAPPIASAALTAPQVISVATHSASYPLVAGNAGGDTAVSWDGYTDGLQVSMRAAGGSWDATPSLLSTAGARVATRQVAVDASGAATAVWSEYLMVMSHGHPSPGPVSIHTARRPAGGSWGAAEQLSTNGVGAGYASVVAAGPDGHVVALWSENGPPLSATRTRTGAWSAATALPSSSYGQTPVVALDAQGTATVAWEDPNNNHVMSATLPAGGTWTAAVDVSAAVGFEPVMALAPSGDATIVWNSGTHREISARRPTAGGTWSAPAPISIDGGLDYYQPTVVVDDAGRATAAWSQADQVGGSADYHQMVATRAADGTWRTPVSLGKGSSDLIALSASPGGKVAAAWRGLDATTHYVVESTSYVPGGSWSATADVTDLGNAQPDVAVDGGGDVLLVAAPSSLVTTLADDVAGPELRDLSIPATATAGSPVSFAVTPLDVWSGPATTSWSFGDGTTATGAAPTHEYAAAGPETVSVTATDALGHATTQSGTIVVSAAAAAPQAPAGDAPAAAATTVPDAGPPMPEPSPAACVSRRVIAIHFGLPADRTARAVSLDVTGRPTQRLDRRSRETTIDLRGIAISAVTVTIRIRSSTGRLLTDTRRYKTCGR